MHKILVELGRFGSIFLFIIVGLLVALLVVMGMSAITNENGGEASIRLPLEVALIVAIIAAVTLGGFLVNLAFRADRLEKRISQLGTYDTLTGLLNRRIFMDRAEHLFHIAEREKEALSIVVISIDHFKNINNVHGHAAGDRALVAFAKLLNSTLRKSDLSCRYSGEEFALFLPKTNEQQGWAFCERIHQITRQEGLSYEGLSINPTLSIGVVSFPEEQAENVNELLQLADRALYHAKKIGRNRTVNYIKGI